MSPVPTANEPISSPQICIRTQSAQLTISDTEQSSRAEDSGYQSSDVGSKLTDESQDDAPRHDGLLHKLTSSVSRGRSLSMLLDKVKQGAALGWRGPTTPRTSTAKQAGPVKKAAEPKAAEDAKEVSGKQETSAKKKAPPPKKS